MKNNKWSKHFHYLSLKFHNKHLVKIRLEYINFLIKKKIKLDSRDAFFKNSWNWIWEIYTE